jgi:ribosomal protein L3 glutamine methyltransferase
MIERQLMPPNEPRTVLEFVEWAAARFEAAGLAFGHGTDNAFDEAAWLVLHALGLPLDDLESHAAHILNAGERDAVRELMEARITSRKPAAYLTGEAWFAGMPFYVDERVIVPRSHLAEPILERFEPWIDPQEVRSALDLCTGSGCIAVALALAFADAEVDAADISADALAVAENNIRRHGLTSRVRLVQSDLFENLDDRRYDLIVTNPPYVEEDAMSRMAPEYHHEPDLALGAGVHGLDVILRILDAAPRHLNPRGLLAAEVGDARAALEAARPDLPFTWLATSYGEPGIFVLYGSDLAGNMEKLR